MCAHTYEELVKSVNAIKLSHPVCFDEEKNKNATEAEVYGLATNYKMKHLENVLHVGKCGINSNVKKDGCNGKNLICVNRTTPKEICATTDDRFTNLGLTTSNGLPVMCVIIFQGDNWEQIG